MHSKCAHKLLQLAARETKLTKSWLEYSSPTLKLREKKSLSSDGIMWISLSLVCKEIDDHPHMHYNVYDWNIKININTNTHMHEKRTIKNDMRFLYQWQFVRCSKRWCEIYQQQQFHSYMNIRKEHVHGLS